jgi:DNA-binding SARP family transcriptional activator
MTRWYVRAEAVMLEFRILGPIEVLDGVRRVPIAGPTQVRLLAYLILNAGSPVPADRLADEVWGDADPGAAKRVQLAVHRLRKSLGHDVVESLGSGYQLTLTPGQLDADRFRGQVEEGRQARAAGRARDAASLLSAALDLWRGDRPLADVTYENFAGEAIRRLEEERLGARVERIAADLDLGRHDAVVAELEQLHAHHPRHERLAELLMLALYRCGRPTEALHVFERVRVALDEEGTVPGAGLQDMQRRVLQHAADLQHPVAAPDRSDLRRPRPRHPFEAKPFVGRRRELTRLEAGLDAALAGDGATLVLTGAPGMGKTSLIAQLERAAVTRGARVLYGGGGVDVVQDESGGVPFQPFVEALGPHVYDAAAELEAAGLRAELRELGRLMPAGVAGEAAESQGDGRLQQAWLFHAVTTVLVHAAASRATVLILDDVSARDGSTVQLLRHLLGGGQIPGLLTVVASREERLAWELAPENVIEHVQLGELARHDVDALARTRLPDAAPRVLERLAEYARGNPLYVRELAARIDGADPEGPELLDVPESIADPINQRVSALDADTYAVLRIAAVVGRDFDVGTVEACDDEPARVRASVDRAWEAGVLGEHRTVPDRFSFTSPVVRATLYQRQSRMTRRLLHHRAGLALEAATESHPAELAEHFWHARHYGGADKAVEYCEQAGQLADRARAWEDARMQLVRALAALEEVRDGPTDARRRRLLVALGQAHERCGEADLAKERFRAAVASAREGRDGRVLASAALSFGRVPSGREDADPELLAMLADARALLEGDEDAELLRCRVIARTAVENPDRELALEAVTVAEAGTSDLVRAIALSSYWWTLSSPDELPERLDVARRALTFAEATGDAQRRLDCRHWLIHELLEDGQVGAAVEEIAGFESLAEQLRQACDRGFAKAMRATVALLGGELDDAARLIDEAEALLEEAEDPDRERIYPLQRFVLLARRGAFEEARAAVRDRAEKLDGDDADNIARAFSAWAAAEQGDAEDALALARGLQDLPRDREWLVVMTALAHVAALMGDKGIAATVRRELAPFRARHACYGATLSLGPIAPVLAEMEKPAEPAGVVTGRQKVS